MTAPKERREISLSLFDEIERAVLTAPRTAKPAADPAEARRKREELLRSLDEVGARVGVGREIEEE
ncbi:hypothetical protein [Mesorhizobium sp. KR9-304]|uniref:hypothetical protein n=1 Tax=Mesorhizobium sp. KR9-304 TaxID=3156614 RepID=UPI0032B3B25C